MLLMDKHLCTEQTRVDLPCHDRFQIPFTLGRPSAFLVCPSRINKVMSHIEVVSGEEGVKR